MAQKLSLSLKKYLTAVIKKKLPSSYNSMSITIIYFALSGLDIIDCLVDNEYINRENVIRWIYSFQFESNKVGGFQNFNTFNQVQAYRSAHLAATYSALNCLLILGDDLSSVNKKSILSSLKLLQLEDGTYKAAQPDTEQDMRFLYCAASISYILDDFSGLDKEKAVDYIKNSIAFDGGIGQGPGLESHGGSTYCALATLVLIDALDCITPKQRGALIRWLVNLQEHGFKGRPNKTEDTCYTFWVGASLKILGCYELVNEKQLNDYVRSAHDRFRGGFSKWAGIDCDPLHTYLSLAGLSLMPHRDVQLKEIEASMNISKEAFQHLKRIHEKWRAI